VSQLFSTSRAEAVVFRFPALFFPVLAALALALQATLPVVVHVAVYMDLPLLVVVYWAITVRQPTGASCAGAALGLLQDSLAHLALGVNGIAKTLIGWLGATLGAGLDADHAGIRWLAVFGCYELNRAVLYLFERFLLGTPVPWRGVATVVAAGANAVLAVLLFPGFDRFRRWV